MTVLIIFTVLCAAFGLFECFFGRRFFYRLMAVAAFLGAFVVMYSVAGGGVPGVVAGLLTGILFAVLSRFFYKFGIFLCGMLLGALLGAVVVMLVAPGAAAAAVAASVAVGVAGGICALKWSDFLIILSTAFNGAWCAVLPVAFIIEKRSGLAELFTGGAVSETEALSDALSRYSGEASLVVTVCAVILGIAGVIVQRKSFRNGRADSPARAAKRD